MARKSLFGHIQAAARRSVKHGSEDLGYDDEDTHHSNDMFDQFSSKLRDDLRQDFRIAFQELSTEIQGYFSERSQPVGRWERPMERTIPFIAKGVQSSPEAHEWALRGMLINDAASYEEAAGRRDGPAGGGGRRASLQVPASKGLRRVSSKANLDSERLRRTSMLPPFTVDSERQAESPRIASAKRRSLTTISSELLRYDIDLDVDLDGLDEEGSLMDCILTERDTIERNTSRGMMFLGEYETSDEEEETVNSIFRRHQSAIYAGETAELIVGVLVTFNAAVIGLETNYRACHFKQPLPLHYIVLEVLFCFVFTAELIVRLSIRGFAFFSGAEWMWNVFDFTIVVLQNLGMLLQFLDYIPGSKAHFSLMRIMRLVRLIRILRVARLLRYTHELRTLVSSILGSMRSLGWTCALLGMVIYTFAICFTISVTDSMEARWATDDPARTSTHLYSYFGSIGCSTLTLYQSIADGREWYEVYNSLAEDVSIAAATWFCAYIAFVAMAVMNVVTGVFVENAMREADADKHRYLANHILQSFKNVDADNSGEITWEEFEAVLEDHGMQAYFKEINLDASEARGLFRLLDSDNSGSVDCVEFMSGCMRLRGPAKALELSLFMHEFQRMHEWVVSHVSAVEEQVLTLIERRSL